MFSQLGEVMISNVGTKKHIAKEQDSSINSFDCFMRMHLPFNLDRLSAYGLVSNDKNATEERFANPAESGLDRK